MEEDKTLKRYAARVGYTAAEMAEFSEGDPRLRQIQRLSRAAARYSIAAEVVKARHCNSGYQVGDRFILDVDGNFVAKFCPPRAVCLCPVAVGGAGGPDQRAPQRRPGPQPVSLHALCPLPRHRGGMRRLRRSAAGG